MTRTAPTPYHPALSSWESRAELVLATVDWAHQTSRFRALGWDFAVRTNVPALGRHLDDVFGAMSVEGSPTHWYSLIASDRPGWRRNRLYRDGRRILDTPDAARTFLHLMWDVNQQVFRNTPDRLLVHAAVVDAGGRGVVMPAPAESGKTTLTAGLVERGLGYLTDEAAAFDPESLLVHPFPKSLSIDLGAQGILAHLEPRIEEGAEDYLIGQWQLPPEQIRPGAVAGPVDPAWIVVPRYVRGGETTLVPLERAEALSLLMEQGLNLHLSGRLAFERLAEVVRRCRCVHLIMADLPSACDALLRMLAEGPIDA